MDDGTQQLRTMEPNSLGHQLEEWRSGEELWNPADSRKTTRNAGNSPDRVVITASGQIPHTYLQQDGGEGEGGDDIQENSFCLAKVVPELGNGDHVPAVLAVPCAVTKPSRTTQ